MPPPSDDIDALLALATDHQDIGTDPDPDERFRLAKSAVARINRLHTHHQVVVNRSIVQVAGALAARVDELGADAATLRPVVEADHDLLATTAATVAALAERLEAAEAEVKRLRARLLTVPTATPTAAGPAPASIDDDLYDAFEDAFRGPQEAILERCRPHAAELAAAAAATGAPVVDLGFGRGELLQALTEAGATAYGVDHNQRFVDDGLAAGLDARQGDALGHLRSLADDSLGGVAALHVVEHVPLADLVALVVEAGRVLRPGGLLLFETPNCTTWRVGADTFYLDPTHQRPVHPLFLRFLVDYVGFDPSEIRPLHPSEGNRLPAPDDDAPPPLAALVAAWNEVSAGPLDYAVLGWRPA